MCRFIKIVILSLMVTLVSAQSKSDFNFVEHQVISKAVNDKPNYKTHTATGGDVKLLLSGMFLLYKNFISSQDGQRCSFHPSCSEYGMLCVKEHGVIKGGIKTLDRLTRCNGLSPHKYPIDVKRKRFYDPVD